MTPKQLEIKMSDPILFTKVRSKWNPNKMMLSFPYRAYGVIEFFKLCQEEQEIIGIEIDIDNHCLSLMFQKNEDKLCCKNCKAGGYVLSLDKISCSHTELYQDPNYVCDLHRKKRHKGVK